MIRTSTKTPNVGIFEPGDAFTARRGPSSDVYFFVPRPRIELVRASTSYGSPEIPPAPTDPREIRAGLMRLLLDKDSGSVPPKVVRSYNKYLGPASEVFMQVPNPDAAPSTISVAKVISLEPSPEVPGELDVVVEGRNGATGVLQDGVQIFFGEQKPAGS